MIQFWNNKKAKGSQVEQISKQVVTKHLAYGPFSDSKRAATLAIHDENSAFRGTYLA